jgi:hypothetical protein
MKLTTVVRAWHPGIVALTLAIGLLACSGSAASSGPAPGPTAAPPATAPPTVSPTSTQDLRPPHHIGIREVEGIGEFYDRRSGEAFVPRGANYLHFAWQEMPWGERRYQDATFATDAYDSQAAASALARMHAYGYNVVRVFLIDSLTGVTGQGPLLNPAYVDNLADFLRLAAANEVFVWFTSDWLPGGRYGEMSNEQCCEIFGSTNLQILSAGGVAAIGEFYADLYQALLDRGAPVEYVFSWELRNEAYFDSTAPPLSSSQGTIEHANGVTYDMASAEDRQRLMDEGLVYFIDTARARILEADPTALVSVGFFVPQGPLAARVGDTRWIETRPAIWNSTADFVDLHGYPGFELDVRGHAVNFGMEGMERTPMVMGEFGGFRQNYSSPARAALALQQWQADSCALGFDGWLLWHWDTAEDEALWSALSGDEDIARALSPDQHPDPCAP